MARVGQEVERRVLARAVRWHIEDRVLVDGARTIVFV
jgi:formyltetrahydrofolate deformylase